MNNNAEMRASQLETLTSLLIARLLVLCRQPKITAQEKLTMTASLVGRNCDKDITLPNGNCLFGSVAQSEALRDPAYSVDDAERSCAVLEYAARTELAEAISISEEHELIGQVIQWYWEQGGCVYGSTSSSLRGFEHLDQKLAVKELCLKWYGLLPEQIRNFSVRKQLLSKILKVPANQQAPGE